MGGAGPDSNRLRYESLRRTFNGGNESRRNYLLSMTILASGIIK
jgi:hypothetical protein